MKKYLLSILAAIIICAACYLTVAFVNYNLHISEWKKEERLLCVIVFFPVTWISQILITAIEQFTRKDKDDEAKKMN